MMNVFDVLTKRAQELHTEAEVVDYKVTNVTDARTIVGVLYWKRPRHHADGGFEHITHQFYIRHGEDEANFEVGHYIFNEADGLRDWEERKDRGY